MKQNDDVYLHASDHSLQSKIHRENDTTCTLVEVASAFQRNLDGVNSGEIRRRMRQPIALVNDIS